MSTDIVKYGQPPLKPPYAAIGGGVMPTFLEMGDNEFIGRLKEKAGKNGHIIDYVIEYLDSQKKMTHHDRCRVLDALAKLDTKAFCDAIAVRGDLEDREWREYLIGNATRVHVLDFFVVDMKGKGYKEEKFIWEHHILGRNADGQDEKIRMERLIEQRKKERREC